MSFMKLHITARGALYSADCSKCGTTNYTHEWADYDHNEWRYAMQAGTPCRPVRCVAMIAGAALIRTRS